MEEAERRGWGLERLKECGTFVKDQMLLLDYEPLQGKGLDIPDMYSTF